MLLRSGRARAALSGHRETDDRARASLDRHATYVVAAYIARAARQPRRPLPPARFSLNPPSGSATCHLVTERHLPSYTKARSGARRRRFRDRRRCSRTVIRLPGPELEQRVATSFGQVILWGVVDAYPIPA